MLHSPARNPPHERSGWTHTLVTILSPAQVNPSPDEGIDLRNYNNARATFHSANHCDTNSRASPIKDNNDRVDWNGSPHVHPLARRNTNPRSAQRHHRGAIWRHILSSAVYEDLKREEERKNVGTKQNPKRENGRERNVVLRTVERRGREMGRGGEVTLMKIPREGGGRDRETKKMDGNGLECGTCRFEDVREAHCHIDENGNEHNGNPPDIQIWRRFVRVNCVGLSGVLFYELAVASPAPHSSERQSHFTSKSDIELQPLHASHNHQDHHGRHMLTLESVFGDLDDPKSPSMHVDDLLDAVKAKVFYFPAYACTSFITGQAMLAFYRNQPELRPLPCADGFSVVFPPRSVTNSSMTNMNAGHSNTASLSMSWGASAPSWRDGSETAPFLGNPRTGSVSMTLDLDEEDPYRALMVRSTSCSLPIVDRRSSMAYGNAGSVSVEELESVKEKDDGKRDSGYGSITGVLGGSHAFEEDAAEADGVDDLTLDTILSLTPSDMGTPRGRESREMGTLDDHKKHISGDRFRDKPKAKGLVPKFASLTNITNLTNAGANNIGNFKSNITSGLSRPFGIAVSMPALSAIMPSMSNVSNLSMYDTFASFLDFLEPGEGDVVEETVHVEKGLHMA